MNRKRNKIIAIGLGVEKDSTIITGLNKMFDLFIYSVSDSYVVKIVKTKSVFSDPNRKIGTISFFRILDYIVWVIKYFFTVAMNPCSIIYVNPFVTKFGILGNFLMLIIAKLFRCQLFYHHLGATFMQSYEKLSKVFKFLFNYNYNNADLIVVEGEYSKRQLSFLKEANKIVVVMNGLPELNNISQKEGKFFLETSSFNILFLGNLIESKGYLDVLTAVDILVNEWNMNVTATFVGQFLPMVDDVLFRNKEEAHNYFFNYIDKKRLKKNISYHQYLVGDEKAKVFINSNAFLLPSYYINEGQPTAILEALSYGSVPIVTRYRLIPDMVTEKCGLFVPAKSPYDIAKCIKSLIDDKEMYHRLSMNGVNHFSENFTSRKFCENILLVIKEHLL